MRKISLSIIAVFVFTAFTFSQDGYTMFENTYLSVKTDKFSEFGEAMTKHNEKFHSDGPFHANVWLVSTGQYAGSVVWSMGPCTFTHLDSRPSDKDHNEDWMKNVMTNVSKVNETVYCRQSDKMSYTPDDSLFSKMLITVYDLKDWEEYRFKEVMKKVAKVYEEKNLKQSFSVYFPAFDMAHERDAAIVMGFKEYAIFDKDWVFKDQFEEVHGEGSWQKAIDEYRAVVENSIEEIWELMPDMSGKRK